MAVSSFSQLSLTPIFDNNGALVRNARLYFYRPGTLDPLTVYQDQELGAPHPQPIVTGGSGRVPPIYVGDQPQRVRIFDNANQLVEDIPWLPGATEGTGGEGGGGAADTAIRTGDVIWSFSNGGVRAGFVRLNGGTIGSALSGASERANADAHDLFVYLWGQDAGAILTVTPSRGASAESDWLANKQITLPDGRGMVLGGISTMGRAANAVLGTGNVFSLGAANVPGARLGEALHALTVGELATHSHAVTDPGHTHAATQAAHNHVLTDPGHNHSVRDPGHAHGVYDPGHNHHVNDPTHSHAVNQSGHNHSVLRYRLVSGGGVMGGSTYALESYSANTGSADPGITMGGAYTGIWLNAAGTGIGIYGSGTGIYLDPALTGMSVQNAQPAITVPTVKTGLTVNNQGSNTPHNIVQPTLLGTWYMKL